MDQGFKFKLVCNKHIPSKLYEPQNPFTYYMILRPEAQDPTHHRHQSNTINHNQITIKKKIDFLLFLPVVVYLGVQLAGASALRLDDQ